MKTGISCSVTFLVHAVCDFSFVEPSNVFQSNRGRQTNCQQIQSQASSPQHRIGHSVIVVAYLKYLLAGYISHHSGRVRTKAEKHDFQGISGQPLLVMALESHLPWFPLAASGVVTMFRNRQLAGQFCRCRKMAPSRIQSGVSIEDRPSPRQMWAWHEAEWRAKWQTKKREDRTVFDEHRWILQVTRCGIH